MIWGYHYFRNHPYTPPKTDVDKRNSNVWKGIYTLKKTIIFGIYVRFQGGILPNGGEQRWFTTVKSVKQSPNQTKVDPTGTLRTTGWMYTGYHTDHQVFFSGFLNHQQYHRHHSITSQQKVCQLRLASEPFKNIDIDKRKKHPIKHPVTPKLRRYLEIPQTRKKNISARVMLAFFLGDSSDSQMYLTAPSGSWTYVSLHFFPQTKIDLGKSSESTASQWETSFDYTTWLFWLRGLRPCIFMIMAASPWSRNPNSSNTGSKGDGRAKWLHGVSDWTDPNDIPWSNLPFPLVYRLRQVEVWVLNFWKMSVSKGHHLTNWLREWRHKGWENLQRRSPQVLTCQLFSCVDGWGWSFWKKFIPTIWVFIFHRSQTKRASKIRGKHAC